MDRGKKGAKRRGKKEMGREQIGVTLDKWMRNDRRGVGMSKR